MMAGNKRLRICVLLALLSVLLLSFGLRLYRLGEPSLWLDEALTASKVSGPLPAMISRIAADEENPPLYFLLLYGWTGLFGRAEFSLRFPSLVFSLLSVIPVFLLARAMFSGKAAFFAALLTGVSPYAVNYAQEARMYSLVWFLCALSFFLFYRFIRDGGGLRLAGVVLVNLLAIYVSYSSAIFILSQVAISLFLRSRTVWKRFLPAQALILLLFLPWLVAADFRIIVASASAGWRGGEVNYPELLSALFGYFSGNLSGKFDPVVGTIYVLLMAGGWIIISGRRLRSEFSEDDFILCGWLVLPVLFGIVHNCFFGTFLTSQTVRYVGFAQFPFLIAAGKGLSRLGRFSLPVLLLILAVTFGKYLSGYYAGNGKISGENWRGLYEQLGREAGEGDLIILTRGTAPPFRYYQPSPAAETIYTEDIARLEIATGYRRIFLPYRQWRQRLRYRDLPGHTPADHFILGNVGYYRFAGLDGPAAGP